VSPRGSSLQLVGLGGGASRTLIQNLNGTTPIDVGHDGRLLLLGQHQEAESFDPSTGKIQLLLPAGTNLPHAIAGLKWSTDQRSAAYLLRPSRESDHDAGVWETDFHRPPRQVFQGWVTDIATAADGIYILESKPDLSTVLWKTGWSGQGATRLTTALPLVANFNYRHTHFLNQFAVSPDGKRVAFQSPVMQENIGTITLGPAGRNQ